MEVSVLGVVAATIAMFAVGAVWYMPLFGKVWGQIHGFDKLDKKTQDKMKSQMGPWYGLEMVMTVARAWALAYAHANHHETSIYRLAFFLWAGIVVPTTVSAVIWGGTEAKWIRTKVAIMIGNSLVGLLVAALIIEKIS